MKTKILNLVAVFCCTILMSTKKMYAQVQSCTSSTSISNNITTNTICSTAIFDNGSSNITIQSGGILTLYRATLQMSAGSKITVKSGGKLVLQVCHIFGCNAMWQGIVVEEGGIVISNATAGVDGHNGNIIEDASIAIQFDFSPGDGLSDAYTGTPLLDLDATIFNRNEIGIQLNGHPDGIVSNEVTLNMANVMKIGNCIFTCRDIPFNPTTNFAGGIGVEDVKYTTLSSTTTYPNSLASYTSPYINTATYSETNSNAYLKSPYAASTAKSRIGIDLENFFYSTTGLIIGYTNGTSGDTKTTIFDNQDIGIWAYWSGFTVHNCTFQQPNPHLNSLAGYGVGIYMDQGLAASTAILEKVSGSPNNAFYNMVEAIRGDYMRNTSISSCDMQSNQDVNPTTPPPYNFGYMGINLTLSIGRNISLTNNNIYNIKQGIIIYEDGSTGSDDYMVVDINNNTVRATNPYITTAAPNNYVSWAIIATSGVNTLGYYNERMVNCNNNTLHGVQNGIMINNWLGTNTHTEFNNIRLKLDPLATNGEYYGIWMVSGIPMDEFPIDPMTLMPKTTGYAGNTVTGNSITGNSDQQKQLGIFAQLQYGTNYGCNNVEVLEHGVKFNDMCYYSTVFWDNTLNITNQYGFTLSQAIIGPQGTMAAKGNGACPSNNQWPGSNASWQAYTPAHWKTFNDNSYNINSYFVVKSTPVEFNPNGCGKVDISGLGGTIVYPYQHTATALSATNTLLYAGTLNPACGRCTGGESRMASSDDDDNVETLEQIANETIELPADDADQRLYSLQLQLYEIVKARPELKVKSSDIQNFAQANNWTVFDYIYYTGKYLAANDANAADILLNYWPQTTKELDENYYQYYNWITNMKLDKTYKPNLANVLALANKCPQKSGKVVYAARALYNGLTHSAHIFDNNCNAVASRQAITKNENQIEIKKISIYPNPITNGSFTVMLPQSTVTEALNWNISVTDIYGKPLMQKQLTAMQSQLSLNASSGVYFATLYNKNSGKKITTKIIVQ